MTDFDNYFVDPCKKIGDIIMYRFYFLLGNKTLNILLKERKLIKKSYSKQDKEKKEKRKKSSMVDPTASPYNAPVYNSQTQEKSPNRRENSAASSDTSETSAVGENPSKSTRKHHGKKKSKHEKSAPLKAQKLENDKPNSASSNQSERKNSALSHEVERPHSASSNKPQSASSNKPQRPNSPSSNESQRPNSASSNKSESTIVTQAQNGVDSEMPPGYENSLKPQAPRHRIGRSSSPSSSRSQSPVVTHEDQCVIEYPFPDSYSSGIMPDFAKSDSKREVETTILEYVDETSTLGNNLDLLTIPKRGNTEKDNISILSDRSLFRENAEPLSVSSDDLAKVHSPNVIETSTPRNVMGDETASLRCEENAESVGNVSPVKVELPFLKGDVELVSLVSGSDVGILHSPTTSITNLTTDTDATNNVVNDNENIPNHESIASEAKNAVVSSGDTEIEKPAVASAPSASLKNRRKISTDDGTSPACHSNTKKNNPVLGGENEASETKDVVENDKAGVEKNTDIVETEHIDSKQEKPRTEKKLKTRSKTASDLLDSDKQGSHTADLVSRNISLVDAQEIEQKKHRKESKARKGLDFLSDKIDGGRAKSPIDGRCSPNDGRRSKSPSGKSDGCLQEFFGHRGPVTQCYMTDSTLITSSKDGTLILWNIVSGKRMRVVRLGKPINDFICFPIPLGFHVIITGNNDGMMNVYSLREGTSKTFSIRFAGEYDGHKPNPIRAMAVSPDLSNLATGCCFLMKQISLVSPIYTIVRGTLKLWCLSHIINGVEMIETDPDGQGLLKDKPPIEIKTMKQLIAHSKSGSRKNGEDKVVDRNWGIRALAYTPDSSKLVIGFGHPDDVSASDSKMLVVVDSQTLETLWVENSANYQINSLQFFPVAFGSGVKQWEMVASGIHNLAKITLLSIGE